MAIVVYAEKPSVATDIAAFLGGCDVNGAELKSFMVQDRKYEKAISALKHKGYLECHRSGKLYRVTWGYGHMCELRKPSEYDEKYKKWDTSVYPCIPQKYELNEVSNVKQQLKIVKSLFNANDVEYIICATDFDREGNLIFDYVYRTVGCNKPYKRLIIHSLEEKGLTESFNNLKTSEEVMNTTIAGRYRAISDWLVGMNCTALSTFKFGGRNIEGRTEIVSIGRVQTPTLAMIVQRENEIKNFKSQKYCEVISEISAETGETFTGKWTGEEGPILKGREEAKKIFDKINGKNGCITKHSVETKKEPPPLLYDLSSLQMDANTKYGFTAKQTLAIAQSLYEKKFTTYPRTDSRYLPKNMSNQMIDIILALPDAYNEIKQNTQINEKNTRIFNDKKVASHFAIITSTKKPTEDDLEEDEIKIYGLIARSVIKAFMSDAIWNVIEIETKIAGEKLLSRGRTLIDSGWRLAEKATDEEEIQPENMLPLILKEGTPCKLENCKICDKETKPPKRFNDKTLIAAMESAGKSIDDEELREALKERGIGTPATRADTLEKLVSSNYIQRKGKSIIPTEKGMKLIEILPVSELKSPELTGEWEYKLNLIEKGKLMPNSFYNSIVIFTKEICEKIKAGNSNAKLGNVGLKCTLCNNGEIILRSYKKDDKIIKFYGCSNYNSGCKAYIPIEFKGKVITPAIVSVLLEKGETKKISGFVSKKKNNYKYSAKLKLQKIKKDNVQVYDLSLKF